MNGFDVVVIGAGISGASSAWELAKSGLTVLLLDQYSPAAMASGWTLAGVRQSGRHPAELPLAKEAVRLWGTLAEETGGETHYVRSGNLRCARDEGEVKIIEDLVKEQTAAGLELLRLEGKEIQAAVPPVSEKILVASFCPTDGQADPRASVLSIVRAAERAGAVTAFGERVVSIDTDEAGKVTGVTTDKRRIGAGAVVLTGGIHGNELLNPLGMNVPMEVMMVTMTNTAPMERILEPVVGSGYANGSGRQEFNGRFRSGAGHEPWNGEQSIEEGRPAIHPAVKNIRTALQTFGELVPAFESCRIESIWAGLIDQTPDALPVIEAPKQVDGLAIAFGFSGHGFCLGPLTGKIMRDLVLKRDPGLPLEPFRLERFDRWNGPAEKLTLHG